METKRHGPEDGIKNGCNAIVWCHVSLSVKIFDTTHKTLSNKILVNNLTYFILRKKISQFIYLFIKENVVINTITNIKLILFS